MPFSLNLSYTDVLSFRIFMTKVQSIRLLVCPRELLTLDRKLTNFYIDDPHTEDHKGTIYPKKITDYNKHFLYAHKI